MPSPRPFLHPSCTFYRTYSSSRHPTKRRKRIDESTLAGAQHKPSLSGPSLGLLLTELSATRPGMEEARKDGMSEEHRTQARRMAQLLLAVPVAFGTVVVGFNWIKDYFDEGKEGG